MRRWLWNVARNLHARRSPEEIAALLRAGSSDCGREVSDNQITIAINDSAPCAWRPARGVKGRRRETRKAATAKGKAATATVKVKAARARAGPKKSKWPEHDLLGRAIAIRDGIRRGARAIADLAGRSPEDPGSITACEWLDLLFAGCQWLCLAWYKQVTAETRERRDWQRDGEADTCTFIVPSPMTALLGMTQPPNSHLSPHTLDATGARRWLIIEFDSGTKDEQASQHWHLKHKAEREGGPRLALVVSSAGKSLHGWYRAHEDEAVNRAFMSYAVSIGADKQLWSRCQFCRVPAGTRYFAADNTGDPSMPGYVYVPPVLDPKPARRFRQNVIFWDPDFASRVPGEELPPEAPGDPRCPAFLALFTDIEHSGLDQEKESANAALALAQRWRQEHGMPPLPAIEVAAALGWLGPDYDLIADLATPGRRIMIYHADDKDGRAAAANWWAAMTAAGCIADISEGPPGHLGLSDTLRRFPGKAFSQLFSQLFH